MTRNEIIAKVQDIFRDCFDEPSIIINDSTSPADIEGWDSIAMINIISAIEMDFNIKFSLDELEVLNNVSTIVDAITNHLKN